MTDEERYRPGAAPPPKLFREPAKTDSLRCPSCGGAIQLKSFGQREQVTCAHCGSTLGPDDSGALELLQRAARERRESALPLYARGTLDGGEWEIIGIVWRECPGEFGVSYPWQEFLLFNPYAGYRWLIFSMTDAHWSLGQALPGAPRIGRDDESDWGSSLNRAEYEGEVYRHFQRSQARVTYVEGEFPWQVREGDEAEINDYIAPPRGISIERTRGESGEDLQFTRARHVDVAEVWAAFSPGGAPPKPTGIGMLEPNPWPATVRATWISFAALMVLWLAVAIAYGSGRERKHLKTFTARAHETVSEQLTIGQEGERTSLQLALSSRSLDNSWAYAEVMLVNLETEQAFALGAEISAYSGPGWSEIDDNGVMRVNGVPGGDYLLQVSFQASEPKPSGAASTYAPSAELQRILDDVGDLGVKAKLYGTISETGGGPLDDVDVSVHCTCLPKILRTKTNAYGMYQFNALPAGEYVVRARKGAGEVRQTRTLTILDENVSFSLNPALEMTPVDASVALPVTKDGAKPDGAAVDAASELATTADALPPEKRYLERVELKLTVVQDVFFWRYVLLPLLFLIAFPLYAAFQPSRFEARRWRSSDYG
ncbi:MAG: DUF4178 domain-containing protein [Myxococcales bacterium]|nr:DUF4178 domain-containing protein [Myxococcales bacterium]MCB9753243.1 DUF4178 domain-containing protein [Myxococcales bacterium]